ncbi:MAG: hypothetical protein S4CHLAM45_10480 [Chlamydiales bacterium]|nr:hypothetical protein [Chlamydiales bacterium]MCH9619542.1 hypothetical protein [Chlamydiales bacterium]MCH9623148.1 hypothetical protein [Chlamydiales bacterium]
MKGKDLSDAFDQTKIQESWAWRNVSTARELSLKLLNGKGEIDQNILSEEIDGLKGKLYSLLSGRESDAPRMEHLLKTLEAFHENKEMRSALQKVRAPVRHEGAKQLILQTLLLPKSTRLTDKHAKAAALFALLTSLRQNIGSCFATAPAIMIQQEQPLHFLADIAQLFAIGALKRTIEGVEHTVPLSVTSGTGNLYFPFYPFFLGKDPLKVLAKAPGLKAAFKAAGLKKPVETLLKESRLVDLKEKPFLTLTPDAVIQAVIPPTAKTLHILAKEAFKSMTENALLKAWEYTLASFAEVKADFTKWNLYASLGVKPEQPGGIGEALLERIHEKLDQINDELASLGSRYDHAYAQVKMLEGRIRSLRTEREVSWIRAEYQTRKHELHRVVSEQEALQNKGRKIASLYKFLIEFYLEKFTDYFQEVYDAEMHELTTDIHDDSPAGFRLMYKYGRINTAVWTSIHNEREFIDALSAFFIATEGELVALEAMKGLEKELTELITAIVTTIKRDHFLEKAYERLARAYNEPVSRKRKPWAYISGGTMGTLTSCYYGRSEPLVIEKRWVENTSELLAFYLDTLKDLRLSTQQSFTQDGEKSLLAFSPTHAFLLKPGYEVFRKGWETDAYTYTWVRDRWIVPGEAFLEQTKLDHQMMETLVDKLLYYVPKIYHSVMKQSVQKLPSTVTPSHFREGVMRFLSHEKGLRGSFQQFGEIVDQLLYSSLPLFGESDLERRLHRLFDEIDEQEALSYLGELKVKKHTMVTAQELRESAQTLLRLSLKRDQTAICYPQKLLKALQKLHFAYPAPVIFGDTNWVKKRFGFIVGPATQKLELWIFDELGCMGKPLTIWNHYLNGESKEEWGIYTNPSQYKS